MLLMMAMFLMVIPGCPIWASDSLKALSPRRPSTYFWALSLLFDLFLHMGSCCGLLGCFRRFGPSHS